MNDMPNRGPGAIARLGHKVRIAWLIGVTSPALFGSGQGAKDKGASQVTTQLDRLERAASQTFEQLTEALDGLKPGAKEPPAAAKARARQASKAAARSAESAIQATRSRIDELDREAVRLRAVELANNLGHEGSERVSDLAQTLGARATAALEEARAAAPEWKSRASQTVFQARAKSSALAEAAKESVPDAREHLSQVVTDLSAKGSGIASEVAAQARERGPELAEVVSGQVAQALHAAQERAQPLVDDAGKVAGKLGDQGHAARTSLNTLATDASDRIATTGGAIEHKSKAAASAAGRGTKELTALLGWTVAAGGVVYYAFLKDRQREKVRQSAKRIGAEIRTVYQDMRGLDGEFT